MVHKEVNSKLKKQKSNALYVIIRAFNLNIVTLGANIAGLLFIEKHYYYHCDDNFDDFIIK